MSSARPDDEVDTSASPTTDQLVFAEEIPSTTELARKEAVGIASGKLERDEAIRWHLHYGGVVVYWAFILAGVALLAAWVYHLVAPTKYHLLDMQQRFELQTIILSAIGSSFVTAVARKWVKTMDDDGDR